MNFALDLFILLGHSIIFFFITFYGFITKKNPLFDYIYLFIFWLLLLHWTLLNGECIITYAFKKLKNTNYVAGQHVFETEYTKIISVLPGTNANVLTWAEYIFNIIVRFISNFILCFSVYYVAKRNNLPMFLVIPLIIIYEIYFYGVYNIKNHHKNKQFHIFQDVIKYIAIILFLCIIYYHYSYK